MKYMGSKARFAKELLPIILDGREEDQFYVEPFVGGANMIDKVDGNRIGNDANAPLIAMWRGLQTGSLSPRKVTKEEYAAAKYSDDLAWRGWVGFNCSYSGKYFGGYAGETKTKIGTVRDYQAEAIRNVEKQMLTLSDVHFVNGSYSDLDIPPNSIIYCDPPYKDTTSYATGGFDHAVFWTWCDEQVANGHKVFVSEYISPEHWICVWEKEAKSSLSANGKAGGNKISVEKLFTR